MNIEAAVSIQAVRGPKMVRGRLLGTLASWNIMLRRKKARRLRVLEPRRAEEIALDSARSGAPISPDATERQSAPTELTVAGGPKVRILLAPAGSQGELHELAMTRNRWFESISLQRRVHEPSVPVRQAKLTWSCR